MNSLVGKFTGIALLLAAGLLAALFAMGVFSATGVSALVVPADDPTTKAKENPRVEFSSRLPEDTGVTLTARFQVDADGAGDTPAGDDAIEITLPSFLTLLANTDQVTVKQIEPVADGNAVISVGQVESASGTDIVIDPDGTPAIPDTDPNDGIDDSVPMGPGIRAGFDVIVTVTGLTIAPTTATGATGNVVFNQEVGTTATDVANARNVAASSSIETLTPKISTNTPGAPVRLDIKSYADNDIRQGEDITVELKNFGVPSSIPESAVLITALTASTITAGLNPSPGPYVGSPDVVTVSGSKITMSLASRYQNGNSAGDISADSIYTVTFKQSAGITNPTTRGSKGITLKDRDTADGYGTVVIKSKVSLSSDFGPRGTSVTVTAKGIGKGGATVYLVQGDCADQGVDRLGNECLEEDSATYVDISLGTGTESGGVVSVDIDTTSSDFVRGVDQVDKNGNPTDSPYIRTDKLRGWNQITVVDGTGTTADVIAYFGVTPTISADEDSAQQGEELTILVEDWYYGAVGAVTIGDETATDVVPAIDSTGDGEIDIRVPNTARLGEQQLKVVGSFRNREGALNASGGIGNLDAAKGTVIIGALDMELDPATVVLGQQFTIKVKGFSDETVPANADEIQYVEVGDIRLEESTGGTDIEGLTIDTNGDFTETFNVKSTYAIRNTAGVLTGQEASDVLTPGTYRVEVKDWSGRVAIGRITYPEPEITIDPPVSRRGTTVTIVGKNFPAGRVVHIYYDDDDDENLLTAILADSVGQFRDTFSVPSNAEIGEEQDIIAKSQANEVKYKAKATHSLPPQELNISPGQVSAGGRLTIKGHNMPLFTLVHLFIGNINVSDKGVETDGLGDFTVENVLVPQLKPGTHTVEAQVATQGQDQPAKVRTTVEIVDIITRDSDEAFEDLITNGTLTRVWHLEPSEQKWTFFDPAPRFDGFNTLTEVSSGQIVTIIMNAQDTFQGRTLYPESNHHAME